jgi:hemerythrin-like domain-containing protein
LLPIDALMQEHRLIERMISQMQKQLVRMEETKKVNSKFVNVTVDFIRVYADRCHHGKEEGILFRELNSKPASPEIAKMVMELINEHVYARKTTAKLAQANESYVNGNVKSLKDVVEGFG